MRRDRMPVRVAALAGIMALGIGLPAATASVIAHADGGSNVGGNADGSGSNAAFAILATTTSVVYADSGSTFYNGCAPCIADVITDARATGSGLTGVARVFVGTSLPTPSGDSRGSASVTIDDVVTFNSATASFSLDTFYDAFYSGRPAGDALSYGSNAFLQVSLSLINLETLDGVYQAVIELHDSYQNLPLPVDGRGYSICEGVNGPCLAVASGTSFPIVHGHFSHGNSLDLTGLVGVPLGLTYTVQGSAGCSLSVATGGCTSIADSWSTSYLGLQGSFTSENGYSYLGAPSSAVPEPSGFWLTGLGCLAGAIWRRRWLTRVRSETGFGAV